MGAAAGRRSIYTSKTLPASHISPLQASGAGAERGQAEGQHEPSRLLPSTAGSLQQSSTRSPAPAAAEHGGYVGFLAPCKLFFTQNPIFIYLFFNLRLGPCLLRATRHVSRSQQLRELLHLHAAVGGQGIKRPLILSPGFIKLIKYSGRAPLISFAMGEWFRQEAGSCLAATPDGAGSRFLRWHGAGGPSTCIFVCLGGRLQTPPPKKGSPGRTITPDKEGDVTCRWFRDKALCRAVARLSLHRGAVPGQLLHTHIGVVQPEISVFSPQMGSGILINVTKFRASLLGFDGFRVGSSHVLYSRGTSPPPAPELV